MVKIILTRPVTNYSTNFPFVLCVFYSITLNSRKKDCTINEELLGSAHKIRRSLLMVASLKGDYRNHGQLMRPHCSYGFNHSESYPPLFKIYHDQAIRRDDCEHLETAMKLRTSPFVYRLFMESVCSISRGTWKSTGIGKDKSNNTLLETLMASEAAFAEMNEEHRRTTFRAIIGSRERKSESLLHTYSAEDFCLVWLRKEIHNFLKLDSTKDKEAFFIRGLEEIVRFLVYDKHWRFLLLLSICLYRNNMFKDPSLTGDIWYEINLEALNVPSIQNILHSPKIKNLWIWAYSESPNTDISIISDILEDSQVSNNGGKAVQVASVKTIAEVFGLLLSQGDFKSAREVMMEMFSEDGKTYLLDDFEPVNRWLEFWLTKKMKEEGEIERSATTLSMDSISSMGETRSFLIWSESTSLKSMVETLKLILRSNDLPIDLVTASIAIKVFCRCFDEDGVNFVLQLNQQRNWKFDSFIYSPLITYYGKTGQLPTAHQLYRQSLASNKGSNSKNHCFNNYLIACIECDSEKECLKALKDGSIDNYFPSMLTFEKLLRWSIVNRAKELFLYLFNAVTSDRTNRFYVQNSKIYSFLIYGNAYLFPNDWNITQQLYHKAMPKDYDAKFLSARYFETHNYSTIVSAYICAAAISLKFQICIDSFNDFANLTDKISRQVKNEELENVIEPSSESKEPKEKAKYLVNLHNRVSSKLGKEARYAWILSVASVGGQLSECVYMVCDLFPQLLKDELDATPEYLTNSVFEKTFSLTDNALCTLINKLLWLAWEKEDLLLIRELYESICQDLKRSDIIAKLEENGQTSIEEISLEMISTTWRNVVDLEMLKKDRSKKQENDSWKGRFTALCQRLLDFNSSSPPTPKRKSMNASKLEEEWKLEKGVWYETVKEILTRSLCTIKIGHFGRTFYFDFREFIEPSDIPQIFALYERFLKAAPVKYETVNLFDPKSIRSSSATISELYKSNASKVDVSLESFTCRLIKLLLKNQQWSMFCQLLREFPIALCPRSVASVWCFSISLLDNSRPMDLFESYVSNYTSAPATESPPPHSSIASNESTNVPSVFISTERQSAVKSLANLMISSHFLICQSFEHQSLNHSKMIASAIVELGSSRLLAEFLGIPLGFVNLTSSMTSTAGHDLKPYSSLRDTGLLTKRKIKEGGFVDIIMGRATSGNQSDDTLIMLVDNYLYS